jgi:signal transduction histidine kinase
VSAHFLTKQGNKIPYYFNGRKVEFEGIEYLIGMGVDITLRVEAEAELNESLNEIRRLNDHMQHMREEERTNISREIHDVLGQHLTGIKMDIIWLTKILPDNEDTLARIRDMNRLIDETITVVRRLSAQLRPMILDDLGLVAALEWQALEFEKRTHIATSFISNEAYLTISQKSATNIFRIYQETLTNVARHANANRIDSNLLVQDNKIHLTIADNGDGLQHTSTQRLRTLGIRGMTERAKLMNGEIVFLGNYPKGTIVRLILPLEEQVSTTYEFSDN